MSEEVMPTRAANTLGVLTLARQRLRSLGVVTRYVAIGISCAFWIATVDAKVDAFQVPQGHVQIEIFGSIDRDDVAAVTDAVQGIDQSRPGVGLIVYVDSDGGDINAAMEIGRLIRKYGGWTQVGGRFRNPSACASACVLIMCAGAMRTAGGAIGIHRPYANHAKSMPYAEAVAAYAAMAARVKTYLQEMSIPSTLYDEMMKVPAEQVRWLKASEQREFAIVGTDPAYDDAKDSKAAAIRGISKQEWLRRKARAERECVAPSPPNALPLGGPGWKAWQRCLNRIWGSAITPAK